MPKRKRDPRRPAGGYNYPDVTLPFYWQDASGSPAGSGPAPAQTPAQAPTYQGMPQVLPGMTTTPAPTAPAGGYTLPPATTSVPGPWNIPGTVTAPNIAPAQGTPAPTSDAPGYLGPGSNWYYNTGEYLGTLGEFTGGADPSTLRYGWYGNDGRRYNSIEDAQAGGADTALQWNPNRGMTQQGSTYSGGNASYWVGGQMGRRFRRMSGAQQDALRQAAPRLGLAGLGAILGRQTYGNSGPNLVGQIVNRTLAGVANGSNAPTQGSGTNTGWMGQMVGFNP